MLVSVVSSPVLSNEIFFDDITFILRIIMIILLNKNYYTTFTKELNGFSIWVQHLHNLVGWSTKVLSIIRVWISNIFWTCKGNKLLQNDSLKIQWK